MPGPVSDSRDDVWGTSSNRAVVLAALEGVKAVLDKELSEELVNIVAVAAGDFDEGSPSTLMLAESELRVLRFAVRHAIGWFNAGNPPLDNFHSIGESLEDWLTRQFDEENEAGDLFKTTGQEEQAQIHYAKASAYSQALVMLRDSDSE